MSGKEVAEVAAPVEAGAGLSIRVEPSDNGVILVGDFYGRNGTGVSANRTRRAGIATKDVNSDPAKRKIQRTIVRWVRDFFPAPKRSDAKADAEKD